MEAVPGRAAPGALARLAYVYHPTSFPTFSLAEAAGGCCELVWVVDRSDPEAESMVPLLDRLGTVVDVGGLGIEEAARAVAEQRPSGILALSDARLAWTSRLAEQLELAFFSPQCAEALTDKHRQRSALRAGGVPVPAFFVVPSLDDPAGWDDLERQARFPGVLKPRLGEGSRDTYRVADLAEVRALAEQSEAERPGRQLVLEEYLQDLPQPLRPGFAGYVSVECVASYGRISPVAVTGRFPPAEPFRETGFFIPGDLPDDVRRAVVETACQAAEALGVSVGCLHIEIKLTPDGPRVIEVNGRLGGGIPEMLRAASGVDLYPLALRLALGEKASFDSLVACERIGWLLYVQAPSSMHEVRAIHGLDELGQWPEVREVVVNRGPGGRVDWREGNHGHVFSVLGVARDHEHLLELERRVHREVVIEGV